MIMRRKALPDLARILFDNAAISTRNAKLDKRHPGLLAFGADNGQEPQEARQGLESTCFRQTSVVRNGHEG